MTSLRNKSGSKHSGTAHTIPKALQSHRAKATPRLPAAFNAVAKHSFLELVGTVFGCSKAIAAQISEKALDKSFSHTSTLLTQGSDVTTTVLLLSGRSNAYVYGADGNRILLHEYFQGDLFGVMAGSAPIVQEADVVAMEETRAAVFSARDFLSLIECESRVALAVSKSLTRQLRSISQQMKSKSLLSAAGRVHAELLRLANLNDGRVIAPIPNFSALAQRVHTTRETASRVIGALERRGILLRQPNSLLIVAPHRLEELVV